MQIDDIIIDLVGPSGVASSTSQSSLVSEIQALTVTDHGTLATLTGGDPNDSNDQLLTDEELLAPLGPPPPRKEFLVRIENTDDYVLYIDNTALEVYNTCARRAFYYIVLRREPSYPSTALKFGSAIHAGLEQLYNAPRGVLYSNQVLLRRAARAALLEYRGFQVPDEDYRTPDRAIQTLAEYMSQYPRGQDPFELIYAKGTDKPIVEFPFAVPLGVFHMGSEIPRWEPRDRQPDDMVKVNDIHIVWTGRIDIPTLWKETGKPTITDHKTTSMMGATFYDNFVIASQTVGYCWAGNQIPELMELTSGEPFNQFYLNAICTRKFTKTGTPYEFGRQLFRYTPEQITEWHQDVLTLVRNFLHSLKEDYFAKQTAWCIGKYGRCPYLDVDVLPPEHRGIMLMSSQYKDVTWNPLAIQRGE